MAKKHPLAVAVILDKSGSMGSVQAATISGFNEYLTTLKKDSPDATLSLTLFDTNVLTEAVVPVKDADPLTVQTYQPSGMTALYDAAVETIRAHRAGLQKGQKAVVVIVTDGEENSSKEHTEKEFKTLVEELTATKDWTFVFLGANQDAWANASRFGFQAGNVATFTASSAGVTRAFQTMASGTVNVAMSANGTTSTFFSAEDKANLVDDTVSSNLKA